MRSLKESILSSNKASVSSDIKAWFENLTNRLAKGMNFHIDVKPGRDGYDVVLSNFDASYLAIGSSDLEGDFKYKIHSIKNDSGKEYILAMRECHLSSFKNFPHHKRILFLGCSIDDLSSLPDSYEEIIFQHSMSLSGGEINHIAKCEGLKIDKWLSDGEGYAFATNKFKNNTIKDFCLCTAGFSHTDDYNDVLTRIIDSNNINYKDITVMFFNRFKHHKVNRGRVEKKRDSGKIKYVVVKDPSRHTEIRND